MSVVSEPVKDGVGGGGISALQNVRNPSSVAKLVLEQTDHVLIGGVGWPLHKNSRYLCREYVTR